jgi:hypothetical protein
VNLGLLSLKEEYGLRLSRCLGTSRLLRITFVSKRVEVAGSWGKLHNEELHNL